MPYSTLNLLFWQIPLADGGLVCDNLKMAEKTKRIEEIEKLMQSPDFWKDQEKAQQTLNEFNALKKEISEAKKFEQGDALMEIFSGAGGVDAQDWASMLLKMYQRYCEKNGLSFKILNQSLGEQSGTKSVTVEIRGKSAYKKLKGESGVHRLVRISPFSTKSLRHTSFALVEFLPLVEKIELEIRPEDLRVDTFKSSGPGGQNVNKLETAVRITHLPTGLSVAVQSERSQSQNKEKAMKVLSARLLRQMEEQKIEEISKLKSQKEPGGIEWGSQIRSYVLHPYKMVKDHRTSYESHNPESVLSGELEEFIEAELQLNS